MGQGPWTNMSLLIEDLLAVPQPRLYGQPMTRFDVAALEDFYSRLSAEEGVSIDAFQTELRNLFCRERSPNDINDFRLSKAPWKKLADEIVPVSKYLQLHHIESERILFPLNDQVPDAWLWRDNEAEPIGIEVTIAQGTERFHLAKELVAEGIGRGFLGLSDDDHPAEFHRRMENPRTMFTATAALKSVKKGILRCLSQKDKPRYEGFILIIQAPMSSLSQDRWTSIQPDLRIAAAELPFRAVYVISTSADRPWGFELKAQ